MNNIFGVDDTPTKEKPKNPIKIIRKYKCTICGEKFSNKTNLGEHKLAHPTIKPFGCTHCDYKSALKDIMKNHVSLQHGVSLKSSEIIPNKKYHTIVQEFLCTICKGNYITKRDLHDHHIANRACMPASCNYCDGSSESLNDNMLGDGLMKEENISDNEIDGLEVNGSINIDTTRMTIYKCTVCSKQFQNKSCLFKHNSSHYDLKTFGCQHCNYRCSLKGIMKNHLEIRHGVSMKSADILPDRRDREYIRVFRCTACYKVLPTKERLKKHLILNDECKPFKCLFCDYKSLMKGTLNRHMQTKHHYIESGKVLLCDLQTEIERVNKSFDDGADDIQECKVDISLNSIIPDLLIKKEVIDDEDFSDIEMKYSIKTEVDLSTNSPSILTKEEIIDDEDCNDLEMIFCISSEIDISRSSPNASVKEEMIYIEDTSHSEKKYSINTEVDINKNTTVKEEIIDHEYFNNSEEKHGMNMEVDINKNSSSAYVKEEVINNEDFNDLETNYSIHAAIDMSQKEATDGVQSSNIYYFIEDNVVEEVIYDTYIKEEIVIDDQTLVLFHK